MNTVRSERLRGHLTALRDEVRAEAKPYVDRGGRTIVPRCELALAWPAPATLEVVVRIYKPTDRRMVAAFAPDAYDDLAAAVAAGGVSWEHFFEQVCFDGR